MSDTEKSGAIARTPGCPVLARKQAAAPRYEMPVDPITPLDQGCAQIQSAISRESSRSFGERNDARVPKLAPVPRTSTATRA